MKILKLFCLITIISCENWPEIDSEQSFDFGKDEYGISVAPFYDGGMIIGGTTTSIRDNQDMLLMRLDADHKSMWVKAIGGSTIDKCYDILALSDHSIIAVGSVQRTVGNYDMMVIRLSQYGEVIWSKNIGGIKNDEAHAVVQTQDGAIVVAGKTISFGAGSNDVFVVKMNLDGALIWQKTYGDQHMSEANDILLAPDGGFIVAGNMSNGITAYDAMLIKISENGEEEWTKIYPLSTKSEARQIIMMPDHGFLVTGRAQASLVQGSNSTMIFRTDADGNLVWQNAYNLSVNNEGFSVSTYNESTALVTGFIDGAKTQLFVLSLDLSTGGQIGFKKYLDGSVSWGYSLISKKEKTWVIGGMIESQNSTTDVVVVDIALPL